MALVLTETIGSVCTITLADTDRRNALSRELTSEFVNAIDQAEADESVRVIVVTNVGSVFCAGANLAERSNAPRDESASETMNPLALFGRFRHSSKPYVGRIAGHCVAGGMGLAAGLDITVAAHSAKFGFTEVRVGVAPAMISVVCLPKMRLADAQSSFLRGNRFSASEAAAMGLITLAVPDDELDSAVDEIVADLLAGGPHAIAAAKKLLVQVPAMNEADAFNFTSDLSNELFRSDEAREGMSAFLEKRPASWRTDVEFDPSWKSEETKR
jgi:methylglutaconyl-CoA hydratase